MRLRKRIVSPFTGERGKVALNASQMTQSQLSLEPCFSRKLVKNIELISVLQNNLVIKHFKILHHNVNSLFLKINEIDNFLNMHDFDIISLNETKLDSSVPKSFYVNDKYNILRRDRNRHGGGVLVLVKRSYNLVKVNYFDDFEAIYFVISYNNLLLQFISTYRPPNTCQLGYFEFLSEL